MQQVSVRQGRPGQWIGVFGDSLTLLVPGTERDRALRWWSLVDDGAGVEMLLDALLAEGLSTLDDFVVVHVGDEGRVRVLVRGSATLTAWTAEGQVQVAAAGRLWAEDDFVGIVALRVDLPGHDWLAPAPAPPFAVQPGLCRVGEVVWGSVPAPPASEPAELLDVSTPGEPDPVLDAPAVERPVVLGKRARSDVSRSESTGDAVRVNVVSSVTPPVTPPVPVTTPEPEPVSESEAEAEGKAEAEAETAPLSAFPPVGLVPPPAASPELVGPELVGPEQVDPEQVDPGPATPVSTPVPEWQEEVTTHLPPVELSGLTLLGLAAEPDAATQSRPDSTATSQPSGGAVRLRFSHGPSVVVDRPLVIGRAPGARSGSAGATLVTVPSPQQEISSNHLEIRPGHGVDSGTALVTDLGSTNGTVLTQPGLGPEELRPGAPAVLLPGAVIDLGEGVRIHVDQG